MNSTPLLFLHTGPLQGPHTAEILQSVALWLPVYSVTLCHASFFGLCVLNVTAHMCSVPQPIMGALVIHIRAHLVLKPSKGFTDGSEILWGHIKALHMLGCTRTKHQSGGVMLFPPPLVVPLTWRRGDLWSCFRTQTRSKTHLNDSIQRNRCKHSHGLTWDIDYFLVHVQESAFCFFTSLAQCINLQRGREEKNG